MTDFKVIDLLHNLLQNLKKDYYWYFNFRRELQNTLLVEIFYCWMFEFTCIWLLLQEEGHSDSVSDVCWHPENNTIFSCSCDRHIIHWDVISGKVKQ